MNDTRKQDFLNGKTIVVNRTGGKKSKDIELIKLAESQNKLVYIGRYVQNVEQQSKWFNPFKIDANNDRESVINQHKTYLRGNAELLAALPELKGKALVCWCYPEKCHGDHLAELANRL